MPRFFIDNIDGDNAEILGEDALHISKSLRLKVGDSLVLSDQKGYDYFCIIDNVEPKKILVNITNKTENITEPNVDIGLYQAMPKVNKLEYIIQKSVELGVKSVNPVQTSHSISRPKEDVMKKKRERFNAISLEAAKQSGRGYVPEVKELMSFEKAIEDMKNYDFGIIFYEKSEAKLSGMVKEIKMARRIAIMIGSEGGFSTEEIIHAQKNGVKIASLGNRILRTETASITAISALMFIAEEF